MPRFKPHTREIGVSEPGPSRLGILLPWLFNQNLGPWALRDTLEPLESDRHDVVAIELIILAEHHQSHTDDH